MSSTSILRWSEINQVNSKQMFKSFEWTTYCWWFYSACQSWPGMKRCSFLPSLHFYTVSNFPTALNDGIQDTFPPQELGGRGLPSKSIQPSKWGDKPLDRKGGNKTVYPQSEIIKSKKSKLFLWLQVFLKTPVKLDWNLP